MGKESTALERRISAFYSVRDLPYRIPLAPGEEDFSCRGKHRRLSAMLRKQGYKVRYRACTFSWRSHQKLPRSLAESAQEDECVHTYLEILLGGKWLALDATWDPGQRLFRANEWDGTGPTRLAVIPVRILSPSESLGFVRKEGRKAYVERDLRENGRFYSAFNDYVGKNR